MRPGKCLHIGFNDYEIMTINGEDWIKCENLPRIARQLYGSEAVDALTKVIDSVSFSYDENSNSIIAVRKGEENA